MNEIKLFLIIGLYNCLFAFIYFLFILIKEKDKVKAVFGAVLLFSTIGFGFIFLLFSSLYYNMFYRKREKEVSYKELSFQKDKVINYHLEDINQASNKVPIEEAMIASNKEESRKILLDVLKNDYQEYLHHIYNAVESEDSEISHYAAAAIVDVVNRFKLSFKEQLMEKGEAKNAEEFILETAAFLCQKILSESDQKYYIIKLEEYAQKSWIGQKEVRNGQMILAMSNVFLTIRDYENASKWIQYGEQQQIKDISIYKAKLKYYFTIGDQDNFFKTMQELKDSDIVLDNQLIELIRLYNS